MRFLEIQGDGRLSLTLNENKFCSPATDATWTIAIKTWQICPPAG